MSGSCTGEIVTLFSRTCRPYATGDLAVPSGSDLMVRFHIFLIGIQGLNVSSFRVSDTVRRIIGDQLQIWIR